MEIKEFLKERGLMRGFPLAVMDEVSVIPDEVDEAEIGKRRNLTDELIVTIDGEDAKDLDDAISIKVLENGNYYLGVHIADVSHYVKENTLLDDEAYNRGTSVYLVDTVVPMLPEKLSNGICSLNPNVLRLTMSVFMEIDGNGGIINYEICESVIKSRMRMTYANVTKVLDGSMAARNEYHDFIPMFENMRNAALLLRDKRMRRGSVDFDFPEPKVVTDERGKVVEIKKYPIAISNRMIEEFMLAANETVARHLNTLELPLIYRVHERPEPEKIAKFANLARMLGYKFKLKEEIAPKAMQNLLFEIDGTADQLVLNTAMLRSMMKARYSEENQGHFGLAAEYYCHFTSPIRRYPDLMVHRILRLWLNGKLKKTAIAKYTKLCQKAALQSSETENDAVIAERDYTDYKMCEYMADKVGMEYAGIICSVTSFGFFVQLDNMVEGLVRMVDLGDDYYIFNEENFSLIGRRSGKQYHIGQKIAVKLAKVNTELRQIDFVPIEKAKKEKKTRREEHGKAKHKHRGKQKAPVKKKGVRGRQ